MLVASCDGKVHYWTKVLPARKKWFQVRYAGELLKLQIASGPAGDSVLESALACQVLWAGIEALEDWDKVNRGRQVLTEGDRKGPHSAPHRPRPYYHMLLVS